MKVPLELEIENLSAFSFFPVDGRILPLDGDVEIGNVMEDELDHLLVLFFTNPSNEGLRGKFLASLVCG